MQLRATSKFVFSSARLQGLEPLDCSDPTNARLEGKTRMLPPLRFSRSQTASPIQGKALALRITMDWLGRNAHITQALFEVTGMCAYLIEHGIQCASSWSVAPVRTHSRK
jgi:hypothetical protein